MRDKPFKSFPGDRQGTVAVIFAFALVPTIAAVGLSVDFATAFSARTRLQAIVDASAAAGARLPATSNDNRIAAATTFFHATSSEFANVQPQVQGSNATVSVTASADVKTSFMGLVGIDYLHVNASASARSQIENGGVACLLALNPTSSDGLHLQGINNFMSENCWAWINSSDFSAIYATGAASGTAEGFCTPGGVYGAEHFSPRPYTGCSPIDDPFYEKFANYQVDWTCKYTDLELKSGTYTLQPGVYCGDTVIKPQANVTMSPGLYVFRDGHLQVQAGASVTGEGVTLFFVGLNTYMEVRGGADLHLKAPATGDLAGFVIVDRKLDWYDASIRETTIQGGGDVKIVGVLYAPQWKVVISGNSEINQEAKFFTMVADTFHMEGNGKMHIKSDAAAEGLTNPMPNIKTGPVILF